MTNSTLTKSIILAASQETVWAYLTEKDKLAEWFHLTGRDLCAGEDFACTQTTPEGEQEKIIWGTVLTMERPRKLVYSFTVKPLAGKMTTVSWYLDECLGGTRLTLIHEGIEEAAGEGGFGVLTALDAGWSKHLENLRKSAA